ncbi:uncharacterized protein LOC132738459 [Ruditapes philippinarum]|uniref:uncharacterized protein LOC132738459 n=1 Tax=Ruditapes philippinarum TaxID=129788 RepID=UPI00295A8CA1|nr:uncharacterized protein LOC132738459 [Ruditapes philippinarum]
MVTFCTLIWICFVCYSVKCETCDSNNASPVSKSCDHGCCKDDNNNTVCCDAPFWTWGVVVGIVVAAIFVIIIIIIVILMCVYCNNKKTHTTRLRHTVSMRSNRIRSFPDLPLYDDVERPRPDAPPMYDGPPPGYEEVLSQDRTNNIPPVQPSHAGPIISNSAIINRAP